MEIFGVLASMRSQLGHGDTTNYSVPTKIAFICDIKQISYGPCSQHFLTQDYQNKIFAVGNNRSGQLSFEDRTTKVLFPKVINPEYFTIWGYSVEKSKNKSARK